MRTRYFLATKTGFFSPMKIHRFLFILLAFSIAAHADEKKIITHEDLWLMPRVGAPVTSPNGLFTVFGVTEPSYKKDETVSHLWIVPTDGSAPARRLTASKTGESGVAWSADSRRIAFSAKRGDDKVAQIWILDLAQGGEAIKATVLSTGAAEPKFSPDGKRLLFVSEVYPGAKTDADNERMAKEHEERKYKARVYTGFPIRAWDKWVEEKQPHLFVQTVGVNDARDLLAGSALVGLPGFSAPEENDGAEWAPDGRSIVFVASRNRDRAAWQFTNADLFQVSLDGGEPRRLSGADSLDAGESFGRPQFGKDERTLYALVTPRSGHVYDATRLAVMNWPGAKEQARIELPNKLSVASFVPTFDNHAVYLTAEDAGQEKLYRASREGGEAKLVAGPAHGTYANLSAGGTRAPVLIANYESATEPPEIVRLDPTGKALRLTGFDVERAAKLDLAPLENFWFTNARGQRIHSMLLKPPHFDPAKKYPLLVVMHGGPFSQWRDQWVLRWNYHLLAAPGYVVLLTNYVGSTGFGEVFSQAIQGDPLKGPGDDINAAADEAIKKYPFIDASHQCAAGASYGGHLSNWMQATTTRYRCLISHAGLVNLESQWGTSDTIYGREIGNGGPVWEQGAVWREQNPIRFAANFKTPVLVSAGEHDFRVPINNDLEYWSALQRQKVESRLIVFPDENHWVLNAENSRFWYSEVHAWLARWLKNEKLKAE
jgi:dipeptidyl aminopeptidase/acylaminoacyl peptidase